MSEGLQLPKPGELIGEKYRVERLLGLGGMGAVYEATHRVTGKRFALKLLLPELTTRDDVVKRFIREAQVAGRFQHPNVVEVYDIGEHGKSFFMVMELLLGESLALLLEREERLPVDVSCKLMVQCLDGLAAAHGAGIIHRDLKPANIFLCPTRGGGFVAKVLDFGISKLTDAPGIPKATTTDTGTVMGTPFYMAPEQLRSRGVDHRVDIYALGVTLYQLLSGRQPYIADNYPDLVIKIWTETPPALEVLAPDTPRELSAVVAKAMARSADDRYATTELMAHALEPFASGSFVSLAAPRARPERGPSGTLVAPQSAANSSAPSAFHTTTRLDAEDLSLEPAVRSPRPPPLPAAGAAWGSSKPPHRGSELPGSRESAPRAAAGAAWGSRESPPHRGSELPGARASSPLPAAGSGRPPAQPRPPSWVAGSAADPRAYGSEPQYPSGIDSRTSYRPASYADESSRAQRADRSTPAASARGARPAAQAFDADALSASAKRRKGALETTLRTSTPFASESLESPRVREGALSRPVVRWVIVACVVVLAAYGIWRGLDDSGLEASVPAANGPQPSAATTQSPAAEPATLQPPAAQPPAARPEAAQTPEPDLASARDALKPQLPAEIDANSFEPASAHRIGQEPALQAAPLPVQSQPARRPVAPAPQQVPPGDAARVGEAAQLSGSARPAQPSAAKPRPETETPREERAAEAAKPAPFQRPTPAIDRTQF